MGGVTGRIILLGSLIFIGITLFELIPFLGFFGWLISIALWIYLTNRLIREGTSFLRTAENPSVPAMGWAGLMGAATGLAGGIASLLVQLALLAGANTNTSTGQATAAGASFGAVGAIAGLVYWPAIGAIVCGIFALIWGGRAKASPVAGSPGPGASGG